MKNRSKFRWWKLRLVVPRCLSIKWFLQVMFTAINSLSHLKKQKRTFRSMNRIKLLLKIFKKVIAHWNRQRLIPLVTRIIFCLQITQKETPISHNFTEFNISDLMTTNTVNRQWLIFPMDYLEDLSGHHHCFQCAIATV